MDLSTIDSMVTHCANKYALTSKETEIIKVLVFQGKTNKEIAGDLLISPETVKVHLKRVYHKLGVSNRSLAIVKIFSLKDDEDESMTVSSEI